VSGSSRCADIKLAPLSFFVLIGVGLLALTGCGDFAKLPISGGTGPHPTPLPQTLIQTVHIAPAKGWPDGATPQSVPGTRVAAFAGELDQPRWLYVLPNDDVGNVVWRVTGAERSASLAEPASTKSLAAWTTQWRPEQQACCACGFANDRLKVGRG